jgi:CAAX protease family protein
MRAKPFIIRWVEAENPMQTEQPPFVTPEVVTPQPEERRLLAPIWHTIALIVIMLGNSYFTASFLSSDSHSKAASSSSGTQYLFTIGLELFLLFLVWIGLRLRKFTLRELIGGRWDSPEDFLIDVGIAIGFWVVSALILFGLAYLLGQADLNSAKDMQRRLAPLAPHSLGQLAGFICLSMVAGFVEEVVFRGYLQRQIGAMTGNIYVGLIVSALIFGAGHGYQGIKNMIRIAVFGALFGILALWRKSLRPGMMVHASQDSLGGIILYLLQKGVIPLK